MQLGEWIAEQRRGSIGWARRVLEREDWVILDSETTGLDRSAEVVQIAVVSKRGAPLLDTLVRPTVPIPDDATRIHGIGDADVAGAPSYDRVHPRLCRLVAERQVLVYNAAFDRRILAQTAARYGLPAPVPYQWEQCVMEAYAAFVGEWSSDHLRFRWQKLPPAPGVAAHSALGDCLSTLALIRRMAEAES